MASRPRSRSFYFDLTDDRLTPAQQDHVRRIASEFSTMMASKYVKGQVEHGGNLFEMSASALLDEAIGEAVDQVVYLLTLRDVLGKGDSDA